MSLVTTEPAPRTTLLHTVTGRIVALLPIETLSPIVVFFQSDFHWLAFIKRSDKHDSVANETVIAYVNQLTNERVRLNFGAITNVHISLNFYKGTNENITTNCTPIEIDWDNNRYMIAKRNIYNSNFFDFGVTQS